MSKDLQKLFSKPISISEEQRKDFINLCQKNVILNVHHNFFVPTCSVGTSNRKYKIKQIMKY